MTAQYFNDTDTDTDTDTEVRLSYFKWRQTSETANKLDKFPHFWLYAPF